MRGPRVLLAVLGLAACESLGRGVPEALLEASGRTAEDTRKCEVVGPPFLGLEGYLAAQDSLPPVGSEPVRRQLEVLFIHGIGTHLPGHGAALADNLGRALGLDVLALRVERVMIKDPRGEGSELGAVNITRMVDARRQRVLDFHELTWSIINLPAKQAIGFDQNSYCTTRRASINQTMRAFVNDIAPDPIAFAGVQRQKIPSAVGRTLCRAASRRRDELPMETRDVVCGPDLPGFGERIGRDDLAFVTHSLGSRATLDALQRLVTLPAISSLLGLGEVANPLSAHTGYDTDARVAALIARGAGHPGLAPLVAERCTFREVDETLGR